MFKYKVEQNKAFEYYNVCFKNTMLIIERLVDGGKYAQHPILCNMYPITFFIETQLKYSNMNS